MKAGSRKILWVLAGMLTALGAVAPAAADDTELFVAGGGGGGGAGIPGGGAQPNILFIVDNSGSMGSWVFTQVPWNATQTFGGCYRSDAIYFSTNGSKPGCGSNNFIWKTSNFCAASMSQLAGVGQYGDRMLAWRKNRNRWVALNGRRKNRPMECRTDRGVHGQNAGDPAVYASSSASGPWTNTPINEPAWNTNYTIFDGNWLNWNRSGGAVIQTRLQIVQSVVNNLLSNLNGVNVGLQQFNFTEGGPISHAMEDISTARAPMQAAVNALTPSTWTPLSETLYEAGQYYAGRNVDYGNFGPVFSVPGSRVGNTFASNTYQSPIQFSCQKNYIVLLTDGEPTIDTSAQNKIESLPGFAAATGSSRCDGGNGDGACLDDMAAYMFNHDLSPLPGIQNVTTYTVGFTINLPLLASTAARGGGQYLLADDTASLSTALTQIVLSILQDATTFTAPSVPVNAFNRTQNLQDLFVSVFQPSPNAHWPGNLKKYKLVGGKLVGQDNQPAVDPATGFFADTAFSFWSAAPDGKQVKDGGAANQLPVYTSRKVYTNISGNSLTAANNQVAVGNAALTAAMLGAPANDRDNVINWARGLDLFDEDDDGDTTDTRHVMGDPLHVRPVTVIYGGTAAAPDATVFVSTNDGYVHAIDPSNGTELWSFIPARMLGRLYDLFLDGPSAAKQYGLDGEFRVFIRNNDFQPGISGAEQVILLFGERRGGDALFALNVTDRSKPTVEWIVDSNTPGYAELGQTWSKPQIAQINVGGIDKTVAIIGGGYDTTQDNPGYSTDNIGNAIYMIDMTDGSLVWSAGKTAGHDLVLPNMVNSIPGAVNVLNLGQDHLADRMYVGDTGGRVWRFDINNGAATAKDLVDGGVLASLGAADIGPGAPASEVRRFYDRPEVVPVTIGDGLVFTINIGSGYRSHPMNAAVNDEFFSIRDFMPLKPIKTANYGPPVTRNDLVDVTFDTQATLLDTDKGWRLGMVQAAGEKILSSSITFNGTVFFTSFSPGGAANACVASNGQNRAYAVHVTNGAPIKKPDTGTNPKPPTPADRFTVLKQGGVAPDPVFFFPADTNGKPVVCVGVECFDPQQGRGGGRTFWVEDETQ